MARPKPRKGSYREAVFKKGVRTVKEVVDVVSYVTGEPRSRVNQFARKLIDDGLLPKSVGKDIKKVGPESAVLLICAIAHADRTADVTSTASEFTQLESHKLHGELLKLIRDIGIRHEPKAIDALRFFLTCKDQWLYRISISKSYDGNPYIELGIATERDNKKYPSFLINNWFFYKRTNIDRAVRKYEIGQAGVWALRYLMWLPSIPGDPSDFDDFLRDMHGMIDLEGNSVQSDG
jgi:hypothetical protein